MACTARRTLLLRCAALVGTLLCQSGSVRLGAQRVPPLGSAREILISAEAENLSPVSGLQISRSGVIAVVLPQDNQIRFFDSSGRSLGAFGRSGEGPGEFRRISVTGWKSDTFWVADPVTSRLTFITPSRQLLRTSGLPQTIVSSIGSQSVGTALFTAQSTDGTLLLALASRRPVAEQPRRAGDTRVGAPVVKATPDGVIIRPTYVVPDASELCTRRIDPPSGATRGGPILTIPFCASPRFATSADGRLFVATLPSSNTRKPSEYQVVSLNAQTGDTLFAVTAVSENARISQRVIDSVKKKVITDPASSPELRRGYANLEFPTVYPPAVRVLAGEDGTVWINEYSADASRNRWLVLGPTGTVLGRLELPSTTLIMRASAAQFWATITDPDGVQDIARFRVIPLRR